jgi:hypothetical protein
MHLCRQAADFVATMGGEAQLPSQFALAQVLTRSICTAAEACTSRQWLPVSHLAIPLRDAPQGPLAALRSPLPRMTGRTTRWMVHVSNSGQSDVPHIQTRCGTSAAALLKGAPARRITLPEGPLTAVPLVLMT